MSSGQYIGVIRVLLALKDTLEETANRANEIGIVSRSQQYVQYIESELQHLTGSPAERDQDDITETVMSHLSAQLYAARGALLRQGWQAVLDHSHVMLNALPGDPESRPKRDLPKPS